MEPLNEESIAALRELQEQPFGLTLARLREEAGLSQGALAKAAGISRPYLTQVENGYRRPSPDVAHRLVVALNMDPGVVPLLTGQLRVDDLVRMQQIAEVMLMLQERLTSDEWALVNTTFGNDELLGIIDLYSRTTHGADPLQIKALEPVPGWSKLSPKNRTLVKQLVEQLLVTQDPMEGEHDAD